MLFLASACLTKAIVIDYNCQLRSPRDGSLPLTSYYITPFFFHLRDYNHRYQYGEQ